MCSSIVDIAKARFHKLKQSNHTEIQLLNELQSLRDHLRQTYQMTSGRTQHYESIQNELNALINEIDACWWELFTKRTKRNG